MEPQRFDALSRSLANGLSRRQILARLGMGSLGAAGLATTARRRVVAQAATCRLELIANVRLGAGAGAMIGGSVPGELRGQLEFGIGEAGAIDEARLLLEDGTELSVVGQVLGRAVHLRVAVAENQQLVLVGTAEQDLGTCQGAVDGLLTGPQPGDLGDWHATATSLGQRSPSPGGSTSGSQSGQTTGARATEATEEETETDTEQDCPEGQERCAGTCVDTSSDPTHCGACTISCVEGETCENGVCQSAPGEPAPACAAGLTNCYGVCVDLQSNPAYCGTCDTPCPTFCQDGVCVDDPITCPENLTSCNGVCADLQSDPDNCGACGTLCPASFICRSGGCVCQAPLTNCYGVCMDLQNDPDNCGLCSGVLADGRCPPGFICRFGVCSRA